MTAAIEVPDMLDDYDVPADDEGRKAWKVDSLSKATWALEKSADLARRQREIRAIAEAKIARWEAWAREEIAKFDRDRDFFEDSVAAYALERRAEDPKRNKSLVTPFGTVKTHEGTGGWTVDQEVAIRWAEENRPEFVQTKKTFTLGEAKKFFVITADGEVHDPVLGLLVEGIVPGPKQITTSVILDLGGSS